MLHQREDSKSTMSVDDERSTKQLPTTKSTSLEDLIMWSSHDETTELQATIRKIPESDGASNSASMRVDVAPVPSRHVSERLNSCSTSSVPLSGYTVPARQNRPPRRTATRTKKLIDYTKTRGQQYDHRASPVAYKSISSASSSTSISSDPQVSQASLSVGPVLGHPRIVDSQIKRELLELQALSLRSRHESDERVEFDLKIPSTHNLKRSRRRSMPSKQEDEHVKNGKGFASCGWPESAFLSGTQDSANHLGVPSSPLQVQLSIERQRIQDMCEFRKYSNDLDISCSPPRTFFRNQPKHPSKSRLTVFQREIRSIASSSEADDDTTISSGGEGWSSQFSMMKISPTSPSDLLASTRADIEIACEILHDDNDEESDQSDCTPLATTSNDASAA